MTDEFFSKMLDKEYEIRLNGAALGYILSLLSDEQRILNEEMQNNITSSIAAMAAAANNVVGNSFLHETYRAAGAEFIAKATGLDKDAITTIMSSTDPEEIKKATQKVTKLKGRKLN